MAATEDYTSLVPFYTFPDRREEQIEALRINPLLQRMKDCANRMRVIRIDLYITMSTPNIRSTTPTGFAFGRGNGIYFIRLILLKIQDNIGGTPSVMI